MQSLENSGDLRHGVPLPGLDLPYLLSLLQKSRQAILDFCSLLLKKRSNHIAFLNPLVVEREVLLQGVGHGHLRHPDETSPPYV